MTKEQALPGIPILAPGERITADIVNYIQYAKEKGCSLTGPPCGRMTERALLAMS